MSLATAADDEQSVTPRQLTSALAVAIAAASATSALAAPTAVEIPFPSAWTGTPENIAKGPGESMLVLFSSGSVGVARLDADGTWTDLSDKIPASRHPYDATTDAAGNIWVSETAVGKVARISPNGAVDEFSVGVGTYPAGVTIGPDGNVWVALPGTNRVGRVTPSGGVSTFPVAPGLNEVASAGGSVWVSFPNNPRIARIDPATGHATIILAGLTPFTGTQKLAAGPDGNLWLTARNSMTPTAGRVVSVSPEGVVTPRPGVMSGALGVARGADERMWFSDSAQNALIPAQIGPPFALDTPLAASTWPRDLASDDAGNVWGVGGSGANTAWRVGLAAPTIGTPTVVTVEGRATITVPVDANGQATTVTARLDGGATRTVSLDRNSSGKRNAALAFSDLRPGTTYAFSVDAQNDSGSARRVMGSFSLSGGESGGARPTTPPQSSGNSNNPPASNTRRPGDSRGPDEPQMGRSVGADVSHGRVWVTRPGSSTPVDLNSIDGPLPTGTMIDATRGKVTLTSAMPGGKTQDGAFWGGRFVVGQTTATGMVDIRLDTRLSCGPRSASRGIREAAAAPRRRVLWGRDSGGKFRTHGRDSVATVRGTEWSTTVTCTGTTTRVTEGAVEVRDLTRGRTVLVTAGKAYTARRR